MGFGPSWMMMLMLLSGGTGNRLLDFASTSSYWKAREVTVSVDTMAAELKVAAPEPDAAGGGKPAAVRRLMAIRTLGELKKPEALPILRGLADSKEMFVGEYVARAIASIEGKPYTAPQPSAAARASDVWLLPADCCIVGQVQMPSKQTAGTIDQLIAAVPAMPGMPVDREAMLDQLTRAVMDVAEQTGDIRLDGVTVGVSGKLDPDNGFGVVIVRGAYDVQAVQAALRKAQVRSEAVGEQTVFMPDNEVALLAPAGDRFMVIGGSNRKSLPLESVMAAIKAGKGMLGNDKDMVKLIDTMDASQPLWAVVKMTDSYRVIPAIAVFDQLTVVGRNQEKTVEVECLAKGSDAEKVRLMVGQINEEIARGLGDMRQQAQQIPPLQMLVTIMESIECNSDGANARMTASLPADPTAVMMVPMMMWGVRAEARPTETLPPVRVQAAPRP